MKIPVTKNLKIQLLKSLETGFIDTDLFPGILEAVDLSCLPTAELIQRAATIKEMPRRLTVEEAAELWRELDKGNFDLNSDQ